MEDSRDELDRILDEGIAAYSDAQPLAGIEERILERVRLSSRSHSNAHGWRNALIYGLAALVVVGFLAVVLRQHAPEPSSIASKTNSSDVHIQTETVKEAPQPRISRPRHLYERMLRPATATSPKQDSFPTPSPLTREEHLLQLLARTSPDQVAQTAESMSQGIPPIEVLPITIAPLPSGGDGQ